MKKKTTTKSKVKAAAPVDPGLRLAKLCREAAEDKKAEDVVLLDVRKVSSIADYLLICSGNSEPHLKAIAEEISVRLKAAGVRPKGRDGFPTSRWVVVDYGDVMVHIMHPETRDHYALESLWGDAKRVK